MVPFFENDLIVWDNDQEQCMPCAGFCLYESCTLFIQVLLKAPFFIMLVLSWKAQETLVWSPRGKPNAIPQQCQ